MRRFIIALAFLIATPATAQERVDPDRLDGTWQLIIDVDPSEESSALARIALRAVSGLLDEIEVRFAFLDDDRLRVMVEAFGEKDEDWSEWYVSSEGYLVLGENEHFDVEETVFVFEDDRLVSYEVGADGSLRDRSGLSLERVGS